MNHADVKRQLADYLEGELDLSDRAGVDAHLDACPDCAEEVREMRQTIQLLRSMPDPEQPPMVAANVMRRIRAGETQPSFWQRVLRGVTSVLEPSVVLPVSAMGVAALVTLVVRDPQILDQWRVTPTDSVFAEADASSLGSGQDIAGFPLTAAVPGASGSSRPSATGSSVVGRAGRGAGLAEAGSAKRAREFAAGAPNRVRLRIRTTAAAPSRRPRASGAPESLHFAGSRAGTELESARSPGAARLFRSLGQPEVGPLLVAQPVPGETSADWSPAGAGDPRDEWLARGLEDPIGLAAFIQSKNLAEQELWVARLADRAAARGLLDDLVVRLRESGDVAAAVLSDDFLSVNAAAGAEPAPESALPFSGGDSRPSVMSR